MKLAESERHIMEQLWEKGEMTAKEIAAVLNIPLSTVLSKYRRALRKLEKALEEEKV